MIDRPFVQPRLQSSQAHFSKVPQADIPRSVFNRNHQFKSTFNAGYLIPVYVDEVLPGDSFKLSMTTFARLATPVVPLMDNLYCDAFFFFVPNRLIWNNWERFNGAQDDPGDSTDFEVPTMTSTAVTGYSVESLHDYFGIPTGVPGLEHISLFHRAYNLIWNEWFRDQNLQHSVVVDKGDGPDNPADYVLLRRGKRHDYYTSSLPWTQKGPAVTLPLGSSAPVSVSDGTTNPFAEVRDVARNDWYRLNTDDPSHRLVVGNTVSTSSLGHMFTPICPLLLRQLSILCVRLFSFRSSMNAMPAAVRDILRFFVRTLVLFPRILAFSVRNILADLKVRSLSILLFSSPRLVRLAQRRRRVTLPHMASRPRLLLSMDSLNRLLNMVLLSVS